MKYSNLLAGGVLLGTVVYFQATRPIQAAGEVDEAHEEHFELAEPMGRMQQFLDKLYFSGKEKNWELAGFYLHELEEQAGEIVAAGVIEDGHDVSNLAKGFLLPNLEQLEVAVDANDVTQFHAGYEQLVESCNSCHTATEHGFIRLKVPDLSMYKNQDFTPHL
jgi:hypothetical protein